MWLETRISAVFEKLIDQPDNCLKTGAKRIDKEKPMYSIRFQELMTKGHALANKLYFGEFNESEFQRWVQDCQHLLANCEPEPYFPCFPDHRHIEEIVFLLQKVLGEISRGQIEYVGIF